VEKQIISRKTIGKRKESKENSTKEANLAATN
jgi:hypothetical protein